MGARRSNPPGVLGAFVLSLVPALFSTGRTAIATQREPYQPSPRDLENPQGLQRLARSVFDEGHHLLVSEGSPWGVVETPTGTFLLHDEFYPRDEANQRWSSSITFRGRNGRFFQWGSATIQRELGMQLNHGLLIPTHGPRWLADIFAHEDLYWRRTSDAYLLESLVALVSSGNMASLDQPRATAPRAITMTPGEDTLSRYLARESYRRWLRAPDKPRIYLAETRDGMGLGVFAGEPIAPHTPIVPWGAALSWTLLPHSEQQITYARQYLMDIRVDDPEDGLHGSKEVAHHLLLQDGSTHGNLAIYINHSERPNTFVHDVNLVSC